MVPLAQLHYIWDTGRGISLFYALTTGGNAKKVALTMLAIAAIKVATGPVFQRVTHQAIQHIVTSDTIQLRVTQRLPEGWMDKILNFAADGASAGSLEALATAQAWWHNDTINTLNTPGYFCEGICEGNVPGAGISYNCSSATQLLNLYTAKGTIIFSINTTITQDSNSTPFLLLTTLHSSAVDNNCTATLTIDTCHIYSGTVEYPVILQNSTITLDSNKLNNITVLSTYIDPGDLPTAMQGTPAGTLQGVKDFYGFYLGTSTSVLNPSQYIGSSMLADMFYHADASSYDNFTFSTCVLTWSNPTDYVLNSMQNFLFHAALHASNSTEVQEFQVQHTRPTLVFHSQFGYLAAASSLALLGPFLTIFQPQGWSLLGQTVSLSPLETARAFHAPLFVELAGQHFTADQILEFGGSTAVKYINGAMAVIENRDRNEGQIHNNEVQAEDDGVVSTIISYLVLKKLINMYIFRMEISVVKEKLMNCQSSHNIALM